MGKQVVFAVICLVVGVLAGFLIAAAIAPERSQTGAVPDVAATDCGGKPLDTSKLRDNPPSNSGETHRKPPPRDEPPPRELNVLAEILAKTAIPPIPTGAGVITGHVLTPVGEPVSGVVIEASSDYPDEEDSCEDTAEKRIATRIRHERWLDAATIKTTTADDGSYRLIGLAKDVEYGVRARADGWMIEPKVRSRKEFTDGDIANFVAEPSVTLDIRVFLPDGRPATSGDMDCDSTSGKGDWGGQIEDGGCTFTLPLGTWKVSAKAGKHREMTAEAVEVTLVAGVVPEPVELHLKSSPGIVGTVKHLGKIVGVRSSVLLQANPPAEPPPAGLDGVEEGGRGGDSFKFLGLTAGTYRVLLMAEGVAVDWEDLVVTDALVEVELQLPAPAREDYIIVRCYDPAGKLISDVDLHILYKNDYGYAGSDGGELQQPDGSHWLSKQLVAGVRNEDEEGEGWYEVTVSSKEYGSKLLRYERDDTHEMEVRFGEPAMVTLTVANFNDNPYRAALHWGLVHPGSDVHDGCYRGDDGPAVYASPFKLRPQAPGEYELVLTVTDESQWYYRELLRQPVVLAAGENALSALVPTLYTLTITADDEDALDRIDIRGKGDAFPLQACDREVRQGAVRVKAIPPGVYVLTSNDGRLELTVSSDTTVKFEPPPYDCVVLRVSDRADIEALGLHDGDKLMEVDGVKVPDEDGLDWTYTHVSLTRESTTWRVQRNGVPTEVTFDGRELQKLLDMESDGEFDMNPGYLAG